MESKGAYKRRSSLADWAGDGEGPKTPKTMSNHIERSRFEEKSKKRDRTWMRIERSSVTSDVISVLFTYSIN